MAGVEQAGVENRALIVLQYAAEKKGFSRHVVLSVFAYRDHDAQHVRGVNGRILRGLLTKREQSSPSSGR